MKKQLIKGFTMLMAIMALSMVTAVVSANGQSYGSKANVPFDFVVGSRNLPAGSYRVSSVTPSGDALRISSDDSKNTAARLTMPASGTAKSAKLVFHRYGERYFLTEVWLSAEDGRKLMKSRQESAIQKELSRIAVNQPGHCDCGTVEVAIALH
jgi:hypothetical protein